MREIKFRAWNDEDYGHTNSPKGMYVGFSFDSIYSGRDEANTYCEDEKILSEPDWDKLIIMQFTGLLDKKGKEIYEGDIILSSVMKGKPEPSEVIWSHNCWHIKGKDGWETGLYHPEVKGKYGAKVIGNIYEDKELLKQK